MTARRIVVVAVVFLVGCNILEHIRARKDSGAPPTVDASEEEDPLATDTEAADAACPQPVHPGYCRRRCKSFAERSRFPHARRIFPSAGVGFGRCGPYEVFSEREPDGGSITEFYDDAGSLFAAIDSRQSCGRYGTIPACTPSLAWDAGWAPPIFKK